MIKLGPRKAEILRAALNGDWFAVAYGSTNSPHCVRLFERDLLRRDFPDIHRFAITDKGRQAILEHDARLASEAA